MEENTKDITETVTSTESGSCTIRMVKYIKENLSNESAAVMDDFVVERHLAKWLFG